MANRVGVDGEPAGAEQQATGHVFQLADIALHNPREANNLAADNCGVLTSHGRRFEMFVASVKARLDGGERVTNLMGDTCGECAKCGELLLLLKQRVTADKPGAKRRNLVAVDDDAKRGNQ